MLAHEAFHLVESGVASPEDVDRSIRNDLGHWLTLAGPFRMMDLCGIPAFATVMKDLWPELGCETTLPPLMKKLVKSGAKGIANGKGFYPYTAAAAKRWERQYLDERAGSHG